MRGLCYLGGVTPAPPVPDGAALPRRRFLVRRVVWHTVGLVLAALLTWLVLRGYRDPGLMLDLANWRLC